LWARSNETGVPGLRAVVCSEPEEEDEFEFEFEFEEHPETNIARTNEQQAAPKAARAPQTWLRLQRMVLTSEDIRWRGTVSSATIFWRHRCPAMTSGRIY
jgi:hypothetical protein